MRAFHAAPGARFRFDGPVPGDKSVAHRALILAALAPGGSRVTGLPDGDDVAATADALRALGARIDIDAGVAVVARPLTPPREGRPGEARPGDAGTIDCRNSGTSLRLLTGLCAGAGFRATLVGDESLMRRDMERVVAPLAALGARVHSTEGRAPVVVEGPPRPRPAPAHIDVPVPSAQVEGALALFALLSDHPLTVGLPSPARDHTARLLRHAGLRVDRLDAVTARFHPGLPAAPLSVTIPGDLSSAAFVLAAACLSPDGEARVRGCGANPTRDGFVRALSSMGARVEIEPEPAKGGEPRATFVARSSPALRAFDLDPARVPALVDEIPLLAVVATQARGVSHLRGLGELRHKESDRLATTLALIRALGGRAEVEGDTLRVHGQGPLDGGRVRSHGDHRIAMAAVVAAFACRGPVLVDDIACAAVSFPAFPAVFACADASERAPPPGSAS